MSYDEVMRLPLRTFWSLNAQIARLRAEERLPLIELFLLGGMGASGQAITALREALSKDMGEPVTVKRAPTKHVQDDQHKEGMARLRTLQARMRGQAVTENGAASA